MRQFFGEDLADAPLMGRILVGMEECDRDCLDAFAGELARDPPHRILVERNKHHAVAVDPLRHALAQIARNQRLRLVIENIVELRPGLVGDLQHVAEAFRGDQPGFGALALDDGIGGDRRAVNRERELSGL